jgi:hypothetical protein
VDCYSAVQGPTIHRYTATLSPEIRSVLCGCDSLTLLIKVHREGTLFAASSSAALPSSCSFHITNPRLKVRDYASPIKLFHHRFGKGHSILVSRIDGVAAAPSEIAMLSLARRTGDQSSSHFSASRQLSSPFLENPSPPYGCN